MYAKKSENPKVQEKHEYTDDLPLGFQKHPNIPTQIQAQNQIPIDIFSLESIIFIGLICKT